MRILELRQSTPVLIILVLLLSSPLLLVQGGATQAGRGQGGGAQGGGGRGRGAQPLAYDDYTGYAKLWDGQTLNGWDGETDVWSIDNGAIHADTTKTPGQHHLHYKGPGAVMRDFNLKVG